MARSYAKLLVSLWADDDFRRLNSGPQRLYMALLSNPKLSTAGCLPWQANKWANLAADTTVEQVASDLNALTQARFILCDETTEEVLIRSFIRHDGGVKNPNLRKSIQSAIGAIESLRLRDAARAELEKAQRTDSGQDRPADPPTDPDHDPQQEGKQGDRQGDTEPTYILHPTSLIPDPSSDNPHPSSADESADNSGSATPNTNEGGGDPSQRQLEVAAHYCRIERDRMEQRGETIKSAAGLKRHLTERVSGDPNLARWCDLFPTAPTEAIAGWLLGDKGSMRYYPRSDEMPLRTLHGPDMATVHELRLA